MKRIFFAVTMMFAPFAFCDNEALMIDQAVDRSVKLAFPNDSNIHPKKSDFILQNYVLMSNEEGERWAIVTLKNDSAGKRIFEHDQIMALAADGERFSPKDISHSFRGGEVVSLTLNFGLRKFPIVELVVE